MAFTDSIRSTVSLDLWPGGTGYQVLRRLRVTMLLLSSLAAHLCCSSSGPKGSPSGAREAGQDTAIGDAPRRDGDPVDVATGTGDAVVSNDGGSASDAVDAVAANCEGAGKDASPYTPDADDPSACTAVQACAPGLLCIGINCDSRWECFTHDDEIVEHACPTNTAEYCGCDGITFTAIDTCPDRPYEHTGACSDGVNCDPSDLRCSVAEPACPDGTIASVVNGFYGPCVPFGSCRCEFAWECPHPESYRCDAPTKRCATVTAMRRP